MPFLVVTRRILQRLLFDWKHSSVRISRTFETPSSTRYYRLQGAPFAFPCIYLWHLDGKNIAVVWSRMAICIAMTTILCAKEKIMRGIALWLLGVPVGIIILLYLFHII